MNWLFESEEAQREFYELVDDVTQRETLAEALRVFLLDWWCD